MELTALCFTIDRERLLFVAITLAVYAVTAATLPQLFRISKNNRRFLLFYILTFFATLGVFLSGDLFTTFCFFELMTLFSFAYVANDETAYSRKAALSYLAYGITGGLVLLFGLLVLYHRMGTLNYELLSQLCSRNADKSPLYLPGACLLFGFGAKAGMFPLHTWQTKTYVAAPCAGTTVLSAVLSKTGIFGIYLVTFSLFAGDANWSMAITLLGSLTMVVGGLEGIFSTNIKRTLACSSMSQIGFILVAIGCGDSLGALFHTVNHSLFKLILFTIVSVIYSMTKELDYNKLSGYANRKRGLLIPFAFAALGMSGVPLFSGYVSKTYIHEAIVEQIAISPYGDTYRLVEWVFLLSGGLTFAYMLKFFFAIFRGQPKETDGADSAVIAPETCYSKTGTFTTVALYALGIACLVIGAYYHFSPKANPVNINSLEAFEGILISLGIGGLIYVLIICPFMTTSANGTRTIYRELHPTWLDLERLVYIPIFLDFLPFVCSFFCRLADRLIDGLCILAMKSFLRPTHLSHVKYDHPLAFVAGKIADGLFYVVHVKIKKKPPVSRASYADLFTVGSTEFSRTTRLILYSVSFGLLMFSVGLIATLIYLILAL